MRAGDEKVTFGKSRLLHEDSKKVIPGGVNSNVRMGEKPHPIFFEASEKGVAPMVMSHAKAARLHPSVCPSQGHSDSGPPPVIPSTARNLRAPPCNSPGPSTYGIAARP